MLPTELLNRLFTSGLFFIARYTFRSGLCSFLDNFIAHSRRKITLAGKYCSIHPRNRQTSHYHEVLTRNENTTLIRVCGQLQAARCREPHSFISINLILSFTAQFMRPVVWLPANKTILKCKCGLIIKSN